MELQGRVALVTGAGSGIGLASARLMAEEGARVGLLDLSDEDLRSAADEFQRRGWEGLPLRADVTQPDQLENAVRKLIDQWGRLDIVFANAGINGVWAPLEELSPEDWDQTLDINLKGTFLTVKYAVPFLKERGGSVIITSSINGTRIFSNTGATAYSTSKAGQVAFAKMVALELAKYKIRVNVICPGAVKTNINQSTEQHNLEEIREPVEFPEGAIPLTDGESAQASEIAELVLFLASNRSSYISGTEIWADGANSLLQG
jgi:NAD(P)-dependent dehydrogenase (short-subunit alcohol dehydrogenase family)